MHTLKLTIPYSHTHTIQQQMISAGAGQTECLSAVCKGFVVLIYQRSERSNKHRQPRCSVLLSLSLSHTLLWRLTRAIMTGQHLHMEAAAYLSNLLQSLMSSRQTPRSLKNSFFSHTMDVLTAVIIFRLFKPTLVRPVSTTLVNILWYTY